MTDSERVEILLNYLKSNHLIRNQQDFVERIGENKTVVSSFKNGNRKIGEKFAQKVCTAFNDINLTWLLTGEGEMLKKSDSPINLEDTLTRPNSIKLDQIEMLLELIKSQQDTIKQQASSINTHTEIIQQLNNTITKLLERGAAHTDIGSAVAG